MVALVCIVNVESIVLLSLPIPMCLVLKDDAPDFIVPHVCLKTAHDLQDPQSSDELLGVFD